MQFVSSFQGEVIEENYFGRRGTARSQNVM
jgi:hypothetical protein